MMIARSNSLVRDRLKVSGDRIENFCRCWQIIEFALFGSVLRDDFRSDSDIDVLVTFAPDSSWSLLDWVDMKEELEGMFDRAIDLADKEGLKKPYRRHEILKTCQVIYVSEQP